MASGNNDLAIEIKTAPSAKAAFECAKHIKCSDDWDKSKVCVMREIIQLKVDQCCDFEQALLSTEDKLLVEATSDLFWAAGLPPYLVNVTDPKYYLGTNMLGEIMMEIRTELVKKITTGEMTPDLGDISNIADTTCDTTQHETDESTIEHQNAENIEEEMLKARIKAIANRKTTSADKIPKPLSTHKTISSYFTPNPRSTEDPQAINDALFSSIASGKETNS